MKKIIFGFLFLTLYSCNLIGKGNGIDFKIENKSNFPIENVKFTTSEKLTLVEFDKIEPNQSVAGFLSMKKNNSDGSYVLEFTRSNGKKESHGYGYYTNGGALDQWVKFNVETDSIRVKFSGVQY